MTLEKRLAGSLFRACQAHWTGIESVGEHSNKKKRGDEEKKFPFSESLSILKIKVQTYIFCIYIEKM